HVSPTSFSHTIPNNYFFSIIVFFFHICFLIFFFFYLSAAHRDLHSFPTRRSSDLGGQAAPAQGSEITIGDDVTATVQVRPGTAPGHASGAESSDGDIAVVTMTVENYSSSDIQWSLANMEGTDSSGQGYDDVFDGSKCKVSPSLTDPVPAGGETTHDLAFGGPAEEVDCMHSKLTLPEHLGNGKDFEFSKQ